MTLRSALTLAVLMAAACSPAPAAALQLAGPLAPTAGASACVRDPAAAGGTCPGRGGPLLGAASLAILPRRLDVAAPDASAIALLRRFPSGALLPGRCAGAAPGCRPAAGLGGVDALVSAPGGDLDAGGRDDHAVAELRGAAELACVSAVAVPGCAGRDRALGEVTALALSASGRFLDAASFGDVPGSDTVAPLRRTARGQLVPAAGCVQSLGPARARCPVRVAGLEGVVALAASPDGRTLYAAARTGSAVVALAVDRRSGALAPAGCVGDARRLATDDRPCALRLPGLQGADAVVVSADGETVYVAAADPGAVLALRRDRATGALGPEVGCLSLMPAPGCATDPAVRGARALALAPGGGGLDVAADAADTVSRVPLEPGGGFAAAPSAAWAGSAINAPAALAEAPGVLYAASPLDDGVVALRGAA